METGPHASAETFDREIAVSFLGPMVVDLDDHDLAESLRQLVALGR